MLSSPDRLAQVPTMHVKLTLQWVTYCRTVSMQCHKKTYLPGKASATPRSAGETTERSHSKL